MRKTVEIMQTQKIDRNDIKNFLGSWAEGIIAIGSSYTEGDDYREKAISFLKKHYAFAHDKVLFKPTFTNEILFRNDFDSALSYFIGGDISEDSGFAIRPWKKIELIESNFIIDSSTNAVMGALELLPYDDENITKIAFTFILAIYDNHIKIRVHHSSPLK